MKTEEDDHLEEITISFDEYMTSFSAERHEELLRKYKRIKIDDSAIKGMTSEEIAKKYNLISMDELFDKVMNKLEGAAKRNQEL